MTDFRKWFLAFAILALIMVFIVPDKLATFDPPQRPWLKAPPPTPPPQAALEQTKPPRKVTTADFLPLKNLNWIVVPAQTAPAPGGQDDQPVLSLEISDDTVSVHIDFAGSTMTVTTKSENGKVKVERFRIAPTPSPSMPRKY